MVHTDGAHLWCTLMVLDLDGQDDHSEVVDSSNTLHTRKAVYWKTQSTWLESLEIPPGRSRTGNRRFRPRSFPCIVGFQYEPQNAAHGAEFTLFPRSYGNSARTERLVSSRSH